MELQTLYINREQYGVNEGRFVGQATFKNQFGHIALNLDPSTSDRLLSILSDALVTSARSIGGELTAACLASPALLQKQAE